jgi:hypothetical protein
MGCYFKRSKSWRITKIRTAGIKTFQFEKNRYRLEYIDITYILEIIEN